MSKLTVHGWHSEPEVYDFGGYDGSHTVWFARNRDRGRRVIAPTLPGVFGAGFRERTIAPSGSAVTAIVRWDYMEARVGYELRCADGTRSWIEAIECRPVTDPDEIRLLRPSPGPGPPEAHRRPTAIKLRPGRRSVGGSSARPKPTVNA